MFKRIIKNPLLLALAGLALTPAVASAQADNAEACGVVEECLEDNCRDLDDQACINECIGSTDNQEVSSAYRSVLDCFTASGCDVDDDECVFDACGDELIAFGNVCDFGDGGGDCAENPGPDCCVFANDGECDEPDFCDAGTDTSDCSGDPGDNNDDGGEINPACLDFLLCLGENCEEGSDFSCIRECLPELEEPELSVVTDALECLEASGCADGDEECLEAACGAQGEALEAACFDGEGGGIDDGNNDVNNDDGNNDDGNNDVGSPGADDDGDGDGGGDSIDSGTCTVTPANRAPVGGAAGLLLLGLMAIGLRRRRE